MSSARAHADSVWRTWLKVLHMWSCVFFALLSTIPFLVRFSDILFGRYILRGIWARFYDLAAALSNGMYFVYFSLCRRTRAQQEVPHQRERRPVNREEIAAEICCACPCTQLTLWIVNIFLQFYVTVTLGVSESVFRVVLLVCVLGLFFGLDWWCKSHVRVGRESTHHRFLSVMFFSSSRIQLPPLLRVSVKSSQVKSSQVICQKSVKFSVNIFSSQLHLLHIGSFTAWNSSCRMLD